MKRLALAFVFLSSNALAGGPEYFEGSNGERGIVTHGPGSTLYYQSNRGSGSGSTINGITYWNGHGPGGSGRKCDSRMEWCD